MVTLYTYNTGTTYGSCAPECDICHAARMAVSHVQPSAAYISDEACAVCGEMPTGDGAIYLN